MSQMSVHVRLRPVRFAFIVRPDDRARTLEIFRINTCLWGGKFNPIVPFFMRVPAWWDRHGHRFDSAKQIINGYLDRIEPDFVVEAERGLADGLGFNPERIVQMTEVLPPPDDQDKKGIGLSVFDLYKHLYQTEYQFVRRHKHNIADISAEDSAFEGFCACAFGGFPKQEHLAFLERAFKDAFDPNQVVLSGEALATLYSTGLTSALRIGCSKLQVDYNDHSDVTLFILDAAEPRDLIDFWNLRAFRRHVIGIPLQWLDKLSDFCRDLIRKSHRPMPNNPNGVMLHATSLFSRSIKTADIAELHKQYLFVEQAGANCLQDWYPSIWRQSPSGVVKSFRPKLAAAEQSFNVPLREDKFDVRFDSIHPSFAEKYGNDIRWANVMRLEDWSFRNQLATALPTEYRDPKFSPFRVGGELFLPTTEGFIQFPRYRDIPHYWELRDGMSVIADWLKVSKIEVQLSDAGRATQQIIQTLGGFGSLRSIASAPVVKLLNHMSRRTTTKSMQQREFINRINALVKGDVWREHAAQSLVKGKAVELGIELKCTRCSSWSWYSLTQLDYEVSCSLCLREFGFPVIEPTNGNIARWSYRLIGPFALPDYATGGYAASLAIRFFSDVIGHHRSAVTWSAGQQLTFPTGKKVETDFILWYQRKQIFGNDDPTDIVFGEAKSFGRKISEESSKRDKFAKDADVFKEEEISRMKFLAEAFPGSILVFATMKEANEMSTKELAGIRKLAEWGREYVRESGRSRAPVILLTGIELFAGYSLSLTWKKKGGRHEQLTTPGYVSLDNLRVLADVTQQLYLNLPSYSEWFQTKWKARRKRQQ